MAGRVESPLVRILLFICAIYVCSAQVLTPRTFNLAKGRNITASATCGDQGPELYCRLTGATGDEESSREIIQGQLCDMCDFSDPRRNHKAENAIDGTEKWWQSPPLSRGMKFNNLELTIDLGQEFHIAYIIVKMANSPRPGVWALEKSEDFGETWQPWQYFVDHPSDCKKFFSTEYKTIPTEDDDVLCVTDFSKIVPLNNGEIFVSLTNNRPNAQNFSYADDLKAFMKATNVRLRLLRAKTLLGHLMAVATQDTTVTRRYFYSIKDISLGGRCVCNGHASTCNYIDLTRPDRLICDCQHNTVGDQCEMCDAANGYVQKKWQPARANSAFECEPCQCYERATECQYDPEVDAEGLSIDIHGYYSGGGVCQNCGFNTTGINCEKCLPGYYRPYGTPLTDLYMCQECVCDPHFHIDECEEETGRCQCRPEYTGYSCDSCSAGYYGYPDCIPCDCDVNGTQGDICQVNGGQCPCKPNYVGKNCDMCQKGYYNFPECTECSCDPIGAPDNYCDLDSGQCKCHLNFGSLNCSQCAYGYYSFPDCNLCSCDIQGTQAEICDDETGTCLCKETFSGERCDVCARGYYGYPDCMSCECKEPGSTSNVCEDRLGQCQCKPNFAGRNCDRCSPGFYKYPDCVPCNCDSFGSYGESCEEEIGQCDCRFNFQGLMCSKCKEGLYNYPNCEECNCNPAGAQQVPGYPLGGCGEVLQGRLCECKEQVTGRICDTCKPGYWNLNRNNPEGCEKCACSDAGTIGGRNLCNMFTGQCMCKVDVTGRNCDRCKDGFYDLHKQNLYGCQECNCDLGGSVSRVCDKMTGQCKCKPRVEGLKCDEPLRQHFFPSLDQLKFEIEDGYTPEGAQVKYGYDERVFANFSWRGYAILMDRQPEVRFDLEITKPSLYRLIYRYVNHNDVPVIGQVKLTPASIEEIPQESEISFSESFEPMFANVGNVKGLSNFVLNPGRWTISIKTDSSVFLDYMILVPQSYYEATVLQNLVYRPCEIGDTGPCIHYSYPDVVDHPKVSGADGYILIDGQRVPITLFFDQEILDELDITNMGVLKPDQTTFNLDLYIPKDDKYVLILNYYSNVTSTQTLLFNISGDPATAVLYPCAFSSLCRQVLLDLNEMEGKFDLEEGYHNLTVQGDDDVFAGIESLVAIPYSVWSVRYVKPSIVCIRVNGRCVKSKYPVPIGSNRIEFEALPNDHLIADVYPPGIDDSSIKLVRLNSTLDMIVLLGSVPEQGTYKFLVHYYLPYGTGKRMSIILHANGQEYKGDFNPQYCPGINGCRGLLLFDVSGSTGNIELADTDVKVVFNNTSGQDIWLDYMLLIPSSQYSGQDITLQPIDNSKNFIDTCLQDGFRIRTPVSDFCERSLFTLTTEFNNGAMECECDIEGSLSLVCDQYGGQCNCRPNVIGRTCSACRVGYYGFPRCQPCNCPFGLCHQVTGKCICPPRVTGDRCDVCESGTYGYDPLVGCQECQCTAEGVVDRDINCDETSGQCSCMPGIGGRRCDYCLAGFYGFPQCRECECDRDGTTSEICDAGNAYCFCKSNVVGIRCDQCEPYTYNLDAVNPAGCTTCFCFGNTATCSESTLHWDILTDMEGWGITNTDDGMVSEYDTTIAVLDLLDKIMDPNEPLYWTAPESYLGNRVTSYGGFLFYKMLFVLPRNDTIITDAVLGPDMVLQGNNQTVYFRSSQQPFSNSLTNMEIQLLEFNFEYPDTGASVERDDFMMILANVQSIYLRAAYYSLVDEIRLQEVELDVATEMGAGELALSVEQCECPRGYSGTSCEDCAPGYYRGRHFPYLGVCVPCDCNGHAPTCDLHTGECINCANNTMGAHCDTCFVGYYGYPSYGEPCHICGCPLQVDSNNFADTCLVVAGGIVASCDCDLGYAGDKCERCAPGYYGDPEMVGDTCKMCECSGNINMNNPDSCDPDTGDCLICNNNSTGPRCDRCKDWWYGDAVVSKNCYPCSCDRCGSLMCHSEQGQCTCKPNVIGIKCDRCAPDTYAFDSCNGCLSCDCAEASIDSQCEAVTGKCTCQEGVTGHRCESCIAGYWNYQETGCQLCECEYDGAVTCDPEDGRCQCLPGVTGDRCDTCLDRWVLIPQEGCQECDSCTHNLLDDMDFLDDNMTRVQDGLQTVSIGVEAMKRLNRSSQAIEDLKPQVISVLYESENITLDPVEAELDQIKVISGNVHGRTVGSMSNAKSLMKDSESLHNDSQDALVLAMQSEHDSSDAIVYITDILRQINEGIKVTNIDTYIVMTEQIIDTLRTRNFSVADEMSNDELDMAEQTLMLVKDYEQSPMDQIDFLKSVTAKLGDVSDRLTDLQNNSQVAEATSTSTKNLIEKIQQDTIVSISGNVEAIKVADAMSQDTLLMSQELNMQSERNLNITDQEFENISAVQNLVMQGRAALNIFINKKVQGMESAEMAVNESWAHANEMEAQALILETVYTDTRELSSNAVLAGTAYENIVKATEAAKLAAEMAVLAADEAKMDSAGVGEMSKNLTMSSEELLMLAKDRYNTTQIGLSGQLVQAMDLTEQIENMNVEVKKSKDTVTEQINMLPIGTTTYYNKVNSLNDDIRKSGEKVEEAEEKVKDILADLPGQLDKTIPLATESLDANRDISLARTQVDNVNRVIPDIQTLLQDLTGKSDMIQDNCRQVKGSIDALKEKIAIARNQANLIRVGLTFLGNTSVTLRNPPNVAQAGSYSEVSLFFKTEEENGLLLYAGSGRSGDNRPNQDYMALEVENGQVVYKYDLGRGLTKITHPHYVADGKWYKVVASRVGKAGTLTLERDRTEQPPLGSVTGKARNLTTVLEMHPLTTKFYAGGLPDSSSISNEVGREKFIGKMESIYFDDALMGLWNFEEAENNYEGARERNILTSIVSNGFRFDGMGYVILSAKQTGWKPAVKSQINLSFKTYAENGLLFFAGEKRDFISIEVRNGTILYQFDLGGGRAQLTNPFWKVNDGKWHELQVHRTNRTGYMFYDNDDNSVGPVDAKGTMNQLSINDDITIGGYHDVIIPVSDVTLQGFEGCIKDVSLQLGVWDLNENKKSKGVSPGCPDQIARVASFTSKQLSFVKKVSDPIGTSLDITFKFKTKQTEALLIFIGNLEENVGFSISVKDGKISVVSDAGGEKQELMSRVNTYNDGRWHYVSIMRVELGLQMNIDDYEMTQQLGNGTKRSLNTNTAWYFGNADIPIKEGLATSTVPLDGCIGDVTINGEFVNFALMSNSDRVGVSLAGCHIADPEGPYDRVVLPTDYPPIFELTTGAPTVPSTLPPGKCALDVADPAVLSSMDIRGTYFGQFPNSKMVYNSLPHSVRIRSKFSWDFRTTAEDGVMMYMSDSKQRDHITATINKGRVRYTFDSGTGVGEIMSPAKYNDGQWHMLELGRSMRQGTMKIDGELISVTESPGRARSINKVEPYYFGGLTDETMPDSAVKNLGGVTAGFRGCLANIKMNDDSIGVAPVQQGISNCSDLTEAGAYYYGDGGYIKMGDSFNVGQQLEVMLQVRPRSKNGVLFSVHGEMDFVILQMVQGKVRFTADNGGGSIVVTYNPDMDTKLCDGNWHTITAKKDKSTLTLTVDDNPPVEKTGKAKATSADTKNPIYIGGKPDALSKGVRAKGKYRGCLRELTINGDYMFLSEGVAFEDVQIGMCPVN